MTPAGVIQGAEADGVRLHLSAVGGIKATGNEAAVNRWLPMLRTQKAAIAEALTQRPSQTEEVELLRLYGAVAQRWNWPMPDSWNDDRATILGDPLNALTCLRGLVADQIEQPNVAPHPQGD